MKRIFISCGQFTDAEKALGKHIAHMVRTVTGIEPFFAEEVHELSGLDTNILNALRDCVGLIVVLHPRGEIRRPDGSIHTRASVWIEQEIAIATYIQRIEKRSLPIIAFIHESVDREGLRDLIHLNPIKFKNETKIWTELPKHLVQWKTLNESDIELKLTSEGEKLQGGHVIRTLVLTLANNTNKRITQYNGEVSLPAAILDHWNNIYSLEVPSKERGRRLFQFDETNYKALNPRETKQLFAIEYCTNPHAPDLIASLLASEASVNAKVWIDEIEHSDQKTIQQLAVERESRQAR